MLVILTNSTDATADYVVARLVSNGFPFVRLDTDSLLGRVEFSYRPGKPSLRVGSDSLDPSHVSTVWYRRPERLISEAIPNSPEGKCILDEWSEALEGFFAHIPAHRWINLPASNALASRKLEQLTRAQQLGLAIPETLVTQDVAELRQFFDRQNGEIIVKPLGTAYIERPLEEHDSLIFTNRVKAIDLDELDDLKRCPTLFQQAIRKRTDVRISVIDQMIHAVELTAADEDGNQRCDIRRNNMADVAYKSTTLPTAIAERLLDLMSSYSLRFAAIDMAVDQDDQWYFFEINPNGQWAWLDLCGATNIGDSLMSTFHADARR